MTNIDMGTTGFRWMAIRTTPDRPAGTGLKETRKKAEDKILSAGDLSPLFEEEIAPSYAYAYAA